MLELHVFAQWLHFATKGLHYICVGFRLVLIPWGLNFEGSGEPRISIFHGFGTYGLQPMLWEALGEVLGSILSNLGTILASKVVPEAPKMRPRGPKKSPQTYQNQPPRRPRCIGKVWERSWVNF